MNIQLKMKRHTVNMHVWLPEYKKQAGIDIIHAYLLNQLIPCCLVLRKLHWIMHFGIAAHFRTCCLNINHLLGGMASVAG